MTTQDEPTIAGPAAGPTAEVRQLAAQLLPQCYQEIKRSAHRLRARFGAGLTMQTTALVHEAFLKLRPDRGYVDPTHFLRATAIAMRHALINYATERLAGKRGAGALHLTLSQAGELAVDSDEGLLALNEALQRLQAAFPRQAEIVECRFFGGLTEEETAQASGLSLRTVQREWVKARAWLYRELASTAR